MKLKCGKTQFFREPRIEIYLKILDAKKYCFKVCTLLKNKPYCKFMLEHDIKNDFR